MRPRLSRRAFLKLSAAFGAAAALKLPRGLAIASTLHLPVPHHYFASAESVLARGLSQFDLLLVPAYAAAELIQHNALQTLRGSPHRAHDPEGAFTVPHAYAVSALVYRDTRPGAFDDLWQRSALWPDDARLAGGAALLRRGYSPNDTHPGRLRQVERDLMELRPTISSDPVARLRSARSTLALAPLLISAGEAAFSPLARACGARDRGPRSEAEPGVRAEAFLPPDGAILIEYDWVIPQSSRDAETARALITEMTMPSACHLPPAARLIPLTPLPAAALVQRAVLWSRLKDSV